MSPARRPPLDLRLGIFFLWLLVLVMPLVFAPVAKESFRQPKLLTAEWLALASLAGLAWGLSRVERVGLADLWRPAAVRIVLPMLAVATLGLAFTPHPFHVREALIDLWIGAAALVGWSVALPASRLERLLRGLLWPAFLLALIGIAQYHGLWQPLKFATLKAGTRLAITSLAGNPGDLAEFLVLPCLVAQDLLRRRAGWSAGTWGVALAVFVYAVLLTQTLAAVAALLAGSLLLWGARMPRRRLALLFAGGAVIVALLVAGVAPLRERVLEKAHDAARGDWSSVFTGRFDGWRAAVWMLERHPLAGVGQGAYAAEFAPAKLDLIDRGVVFFPGLTEGSAFTNAHNDVLEAVAEWGLPGLLALAWGLWVLLGALRRQTGEAGGEPKDRALAWAGVAALAVLSLVDFPFRTALVGFPALLFLSWVLRREEV